MDGSPSRTWRGRRLARPHEDVEDQGLAFDVTSVLEQQARLDRRSLLRVAGIGAFGFGLAACADETSSSSPGSGTASTGTQGSETPSSETGTGEIPDETAGPYPGDGSNGPDVLEESGIVRSDIRSSFGEARGVAEGIPMQLELTISDLANGGAPFAGVAVYVWQCDRDGNYSMYSAGVEDENYLRGVQVADADGVVRFTSIVPACYPGRWPHVHFEVYPDADAIDDSTNAIATSQVALPKHLCDAVYATEGYSSSVSTLAGVTLDSDNVFGNDGGVLQLGTATGDPDLGYTIRLAVRVDTRTEPSGGGAPGGGAPPGGFGGGPSGGQGGPGGTPPTPR